jgi:hypothetical protein
MTVARSLVPSAVAALAEIGGDCLVGVAVLMYALPPVG